MYGSVAEACHRRERVPRKGVWRVTCIPLYWRRIQKVYWGEVNKYVTVYVLVVVC